MQARAVIPAAADDTPAALIPAAAGLPALRLRLLLCPHSLLFLLLPAGGPRPSSGRLRYLILPAVPGPPWRRSGVSGRPRLPPHPGTAPWPGGTLLLFVGSFPGPSREKYSLDLIGEAIAPAAALVAGDLLGPSGQLLDLPILPGGGFHCAGLAKNLFHSSSASRSSTQAAHISAWWRRHTHGVASMAPKGRGRHPLPRWS